jgi:hypothetical protein
MGLDGGLSILPQVLLQGEYPAVLWLKPLDHAHRTQVQAGLAMTVEQQATAEVEHRVAVFSKNGRSRRVR